MSQDDKLEHVNSSWFANGLFVQKRTIYLENDSNDDPDSINASMASKFIKSMIILENLDDTADINIIINTPGGCEVATFAIYDRIQESKCHVTGIGYGQILSGGGIILQACDVRKISPSSMFMMHQGAFYIDTPSAKSVINWGKSYEKRDELMCKVFYDVMYVNDKKITINKIKNMLKDDIILDAEEMITLGLADNIYTG